MNTCPKCGSADCTGKYFDGMDEAQCLRRQLAAVTAERDKARYGEAEAMAVIMSLEGTCERLTAERDELQRKMDECREAFIMWRDENRKPGPYGIGHKWRAIDGPLYNVLNRHLGGE